MATLSPIQHHLRQRKIQASSCLSQQNRQAQRQQQQTKAYLMAPITPAPSRACGQNRYREWRRRPLAAMLRPAKRARSGAAQCRLRWLPASTPNNGQGAGPHQPEHAAQKRAAQRAGGDTAGQAVANAGHRGQQAGKRSVQRRSITAPSSNNKAPSSR